MGFFQDMLDGLGDLLTSISDAVSDSRRDEELNKTRPSIKELTFTPLDPSVADDIQNRRPANYTDPQIDRFLECIRQGRAEYVELLGISAYNYEVDRAVFGDSAVSNNYYYQTYFKLADPLTGTVYKEAVSAWINKTELPMAESSATDGSVAAEGSADTPAPENSADASSPEKTKNPDPVDPLKYPHLFILHYFLKDREYYRALTKEQFEDMIPGVIYVKTKYACFYEGGDHKW